MHDSGGMELTHQQVRETVSEGLEEQIHALRKPNAVKRLMELLFFPGMMLLGMFLIGQGRSALGPFDGYGLWILGTIITALAINALVLLLHEGMHLTLLPSHLMNRWVSVGLGATFLMSFTAYKIMHIRHHDFLGDPRDPDDYHNYTDSQVLVWIMHYSRLLVGSFMYIFLIPFFAFRYGSRQDRIDMMVEYLLLAVLYTALWQVVPGDILFWHWFIPLVIVGYMVNIRGFTQHGITDAHDPYLASRSIYPNRIVSFLLLNENLHLEHHLFPEIPSYNLPRLNRLIGDRLPRKVTGTSYLGFMFTFLKRTFKMDESIIGLDESDPGRQ